MPTFVVLCGPAIVHYLFTSVPIQTPMDLSLPMESSAARFSAQDLTTPIMQSGPPTEAAASSDSVGGASTVSHPPTKFELFYLYAHRVNEHLLQPFTFSHLILTNPCISIGCLVTKRVYVFVNIVGSIVLLRHLFV